jgi:hypothetical protein
LGEILPFREIEFLFFPTIDDKGAEQDIVYIAALINSIGQFALHMEASGLKLLCYKK